MSREGKLKACLIISFTCACAGGGEAGGPVAGVKCACKTGERMYVPVNGTPEYMLHMFSETDCCASNTPGLFAVYNRYTTLQQNIVSV